MRLVSVRPLREKKNIHNEMVTKNRLVVSKIIDNKQVSKIRFSSGFSISVNFIDKI